MAVKDGCEGKKIKSMRYRTYRKKHFDGARELTPFIDIVFILLIFFLLTATAPPEGLKLDLPQAGQGSTIKDQQKIWRLQLNEKGQLFLGKEAITLLEFEKRLVLLNQKTPVVLAADEKAPYGAFIELIDLLKTNNNAQLVLETKQKRDKTGSKDEQ